MENNQNVNQFQKYSQPVNNNSTNKIIIAIILIGVISGIGFFVYDNYIKKDETPIKGTDKPTNYVEETKKETFKETAVSAINGVRQQLVIANKLEEGYYYFSRDLFGRDLISPLGGNIKLSTLTDCEKIGTNLCRVDEAPVCNDEADSFVHVTKNNSNYSYQICLTAGKGNKYIYNALEADLLNYKDFSMIK